MFHVSYMTTGSEKDMYTCRIRATQPTVCKLYVSFSQPPTPIVYFSLIIVSDEKEENMKVKECTV
jgi:hypothetical protein